VRLMGDIPTTYKGYKYVSGTLYSGALSKCAQLVMGIHRDAVKALTTVPAFVATDDKQEEEYMRQAVLPDAKFVENVQRNHGFCPQYAATWAKSDGLVRGLDSWWLVRIMRDKVYARKLPVFLGSELSGYAEYYRNLGLTSVANAIEFFKGL